MKRFRVVLKTISLLMAVTGYILLGFSYYEFASKTYSNTSGQRLIIGFLLVTASAAGYELIKKIKVHKKRHFYNIKIGRREAMRESKDLF